MAKEAKKKVAMFLTMIRPRTYAVLSNLLTPEKPAIKSYDELIVTVAHPNPKLVTIAYYYRFHHWKQGENEMVAHNRGTS